MKKQYFAYTRVSTVKQGEHGSSLQEQRSAINNFATRNGLQVENWFEERETAAKIGRREFSRMVAALKKGKASGVIFHKIDRSARNLKDWSAVQDLADLGIDVRFTQESINLGSNEGKLTGDFLAVIAAHYIRNLREEVRKGIRGRLKQGLYPFRAFIGYLDRGGGKPKVLDPDRAPFIRLAFELYATGKFSLYLLSDELCKRGLRTNTGRRVGANRLNEILRNPFYIGIIRIKRSGESYAGVHESLIPQSLFNRVQEVLDGKLKKGPLKNDFLFRKLITCAHCHYRLTGERQKGMVYYRCHTRNCPSLSVREDIIEDTVQSHLIPLALSQDEAAELKERAASMRADAEKHREDQMRGVTLQIEIVTGRLTRLMDVYLDGAVDRHVFEEKKLALLMERKRFEEERDRIAAGQQSLVDRLVRYFELLETPQLTYKRAIPSEKRRLVQMITSNFCIDVKNIVFELQSPFREVANLAADRVGGPYRDRRRTLIRNKIFNILVTHCINNPVSDNDEVPLADSGELPL